MCVLTFILYPWSANLLQSHGHGQEGPFCNVCETCRFVAALWPVWNWLTPVILVRLHIKICPMMVHTACHCLFDVMCCCLSQHPASIDCAACCHGHALCKHHGHFCSLCHNCKRERTASELLLTFDVLQFILFMGFIMGIQLLPSKHPCTTGAASSDADDIIRAAKHK